RPAHTPSTTAAGKGSVSPAASQPPVNRASEVASDIGISGGCPSSGTLSRTSCCACASNVQKTSPPLCSGAGVSSGSSGGLCCWGSAGGGSSPGSTGAASSGGTTGLLASALAASIQ